MNILSFDTDLSFMDIFNFWKNILSEHYEIGELTQLEQNMRGYVNLNYGIEAFQNSGTSRYWLRCYRRGTVKQKIRVEHALINELVRKDFKFCPGLIPAKDGRTFVEIGYPVDDKLWQYCYIAVFDYLNGEDKYTWNKCLCSDRELANAAKMLALFHSNIYGWQGPGNWRGPTVIEKVSRIPAKWQKYAQKAGNTSFDLFFSKHFDYLVCMLKQMSEPHMKNMYDVMRQVFIHGDYHPGNLKFKGEDVIGMFDFDWSNTDARCFDVGLAIKYFCTSWEEGSDGKLVLDKAEHFIKSYQETAYNEDQIGPLNRLELEFLPAMIALGNLYVINWTVNDFYTVCPDPDEYLAYLRHGVNLAEWLEQNRDLLADFFVRYAPKDVKETNLPLAVIGTDHWRGEEAGDMPIQDIG
ncbi:MAG: phosphotransferase [Desulfobacteraceae bacterium]|nr:phosphotransferase [Desulfobacteraceae bacterium]